MLLITQNYDCLPLTAPDTIITELWSLHEGVQTELGIVWKPPKSSNHRDNANSFHSLKIQTNNESLAELSSSPCPLCSYTRLSPPRAIYLKYKNAHASKIDNFFTKQTQGYTKNKTSIVQIVTCAVRWLSQFDVHQARWAIETKISLKYWRKHCH